MEQQPLAINGLLMPSDFPTAAFERTYARARLRASTHKQPYEHFAGAWNAISFRFLALCSEGEAFTSSINSARGESDLDKRYDQERHLFAFFSNGFSALEAYFYGMYALGSILEPREFSLSTPKEQQRVTPSTTRTAFERVFPGDAVLAGFDSTLKDTAYLEWKEVRNVLTHRTAPGRTIIVSVGSDRQLPPRWKINDISLDANLVSTRRAHVARMLCVLLESAAAFAEARIS